MAPNPYYGVPQEELIKYLMAMLAPVQGYGLLPTTNTKTLTSMVKDYTGTTVPTFNETYNPFLAMYSDPKAPMAETMINAFDRVEQGFVPDEIVMDLAKEGVYLSPSQEAHLKGYYDSVLDRNESVAKRQWEAGNVASEYGIPTPDQTFALDPELVGSIYTRQKTGLTDKEASQQAADYAMQRYIESAVLTPGRARKVAVAKLMDQQRDKDTETAEEEEWRSVYFPEEEGTYTLPDPASTSLGISKGERSRREQTIRKEALRLRSQSMKDAEAGVGGDYNKLQVAKTSQRMADNQAKYEQALANKIITSLTGGGTPYDVAMKQALDYLAQNRK